MDTNLMGQFENAINEINPENLKLTSNSIDNGSSVMQWFKNIVSFDYSIYEKL